MTEEKYKELVSAYEKLKENCKASKTGRACLFSSNGGVCDGGFSCVLAVGIPEFWEEPQKTWTEGEKAAAKALKDAGVVSIKRDPAREMVVELFGIGMAPLGTVPYAMFPNLDYNKAVLLRDIIGEG